MQQKENLLNKKCSSAIIGLIWVSGLLMAGSDSPYMPWTNGIGLLIFLAASILLSRRFGQSKTKTDELAFLSLKTKSKRPILQTRKQNRRLNIRYVLQG